MCAEQRRLRHAGNGWLWVPLAVMGLAAAWVWLGHLNVELFRYINGWSDYTGQNYWAVVTILSDGVVSFALLLPWIRKRPQVIWALFVAAIFFSLLGAGFKEILDYHRPPKILDEGALTVIGPDYKYHSFPSGHAAMIVGLVSVWVFTLRAWWLRILLIAGGILVATSRIVVGVHWPLDVIVGSFSGWLFGWVGLKVAEHTPWGYSVVSMRIFGVLLLLCCLVMLFPYSDFERIIWEQRTMAVVLFAIGLHEYIELWKRRG
jgi:membrane-associated phospholipid phosphatase